jgi:hypothetical protein
MGQENSKSSTSTPVQKKNINLLDPRSPRENRTPVAKLAITKDVSPRNYLGL